MQAATEINQNGNTQAERGINSENHVFSNRPEQSPSQSLSRTWLDPFLFIVAKQNNDEAGKPVRLLAVSQHSAFPRGHNSHYDSSDRAADDYHRHCGFQLIIRKALCFSILAAQRRRQTAFLCQNLRWMAPLSLWTYQHLTPTYLSPAVGLFGVHLNSRAFKWQSRHLAVVLRLQRVSIQVPVPETVASFAQTFQWLFGPVGSNELASQQNDSFARATMRRSTSQPSGSHHSDHTAALSRGLQRGTVCGIQLELIPPDF